MSQQELDLIQFATSPETEPRVCAPEIVRCQFANAGARSR